MTQMLPFVEEQTLYEQQAVHGVIDFSSDVTLNPAAQITTSPLLQIIPA